MVPPVKMMVSSGRLPMISFNSLIVIDFYSPFVYNVCGICKDRVSNWKKKINNQICKKQSEFAIRGIDFATWIFKLAI